MYDKMFNDLLIAKWKWILHVMKAYLIHDLYIVYVADAFTTLNWKV